MTRRSRLRRKGAAEELAPESVTAGAPYLFAYAIPEIAEGVWRLLSCDVKEVRKQRRKRIILYELRYSEADDEIPQTVEVVGKLYESDRGDRPYRVLRHLWEKGFCAPSGLLVPRPYGYPGEPPILLQGNARGVTLASFLHEEPTRMEGAATGAAGWLAQLQEKPAPPEFADYPPTRDPARQTEELAAEHPTYASRLIEVGTETRRRLGQENGVHTTCHGDYHAKNVFVAGRETTVIDFDCFGAAEPGYDVGYFIGQLLVMSYLRLGSFEAGSRGTRAFWRGYKGAGGRAAWEQAAAHVARTFVQSLYFELCTLRNGKLHLLPVWLDQCQRWLASPGEGTLEDLISGR